MIHLRTPAEMEIMAEGGKILSDVLSTLVKTAKSGVSLLELDRLAYDLIVRDGGRPSFKEVPNYQWTICCCLNDIVVHGIPSSYLLKEGDVLGIDCGVYYKGFHTDAAWTIKIKNEKLKIKNEDDEIDKFLVTGERALEEAISRVKEGNYICDISKTIQETIEPKGYSVVRTLVGHGIGRDLHEKPEIPGFIREKREKTPKITSGMVLAIEVIYNMGKSEVVFKGNDGWTIATKDGKISGLFEATVAVTSHGCLVLAPEKI